MAIHTALLYVVLAAALVVIDWFSLGQACEPITDDIDDWTGPESRHRGW